MKAYTHNRMTKLAFILLAFSVIAAEDPTGDNLKNCFACSALNSGDVYMCDNFG